MTQEIPSPEAKLPPFPDLPQSAEGTGKRVINALAGGGTMLLALWLVVADFTFPGTMLFQDPTSLMLLSLYLMLWFFALLVLVPLPKRLIIASNLLLMVRASLGWPLSLLIDYNLACKVASLGLLALGTVHLVVALRGSPLKISSRPWFCVRHTLAAVVLWLLVNGLFLPSLLLGYVHAGSDLMGHYVRIRWDGISLVERVFEKDGRKVHLVGMMHIGDSSFYSNLNQRMVEPIREGSRLVLTEGVSDEENLLPEDFKSGKMYGKLASAFGLESQLDHQPEPLQHPGFGSERLPPNVSFRNADMDISQMAARDRKTLLAILGMLNPEDPASMLLAQADDVTPYDAELLFRDGLLRQRNDVLMDHFASSADEYSEIYIPWGAAHLPDIESRLLGLGYHQVSETVRPVVRFWK